MNISNNSEISALDLDMAGYIFDAKSRILEELEEHKASGMFSTQLKLKELKENLTNFLTRYQNRNSIFFIFFGEPTEENLKLVVNTLGGNKVNELTKRFIIKIDSDLSDLTVEQMSIKSMVIRMEL